MKKQLFGLKKNKINSFLEKLEIDLFSQIGFLETELEELKSKNTLLEEEVSKQERKKEDRTDDSEVWKFAQYRFEAIIQTFDEIKEKEMKEMLNCFQKKEDQINRQIKKVDMEIEAIENILSTMLKQSVKHLERPVLQIEIEEETEGGLNVNNPVSTVEVAAGTDFLEINENIEPISEYVDDRSYSSIDWAASVDYSENQSVSPSFWGDQSLSSDSNSPLFKQEETVINDELVELVSIEEEYDKKIIQSRGVTYELNQKEVYQISEERENQEGRECPQETLSFENEIDYKGQEFIEQVDSIKNQYIVGKVAGEDLFDHTGELILAKNSLITREAMEKANTIGKLAELIVNMKIKGGGN